MKKYVLSITLILLSSHSYAITMLCSNGVINKGDTEKAIKKACPSVKNLGYETSINGKTQETQKITKLKSTLGDGTEVTFILLNDALLTYVIHKNK